MPNDFSPREVKIPTRPGTITISVVLSEDKIAAIEEVRDDDGQIVTPYSPASVEPRENVHCKFSILDQNDDEQESRQVEITSQLPPGIQGHVDGLTGYVRGLVNATIA